MFLFSCLFSSLWRKGTVEFASLAVFAFMTLYLFSFLEQKPFSLWYLCLYSNTVNTYIDMALSDEQSSQLAVTDGGDSRSLHQVSINVLNCGQQVPMSARNEIAELEMYNSELQ